MAAENAAETRRSRARFVCPARNNSAEFHAAVATAMQDDDDLYGGYSNLDDGLADVCAPHACVPWRERSVQSCQRDCCDSPRAQDLQDAEFQRAMKTAQGQRPGLRTAMRPTTGTRGAPGLAGMQPPRRCRALTRLAAKPTTAIRAPGTAARGRTALGTAARLATGVAPIVRRCT